MTDDWRADSFVDAVGRWARAAAALVRWRSARVGVFGYAINGMGDIQVDIHTLVRVLGSQALALAPGDLHRAATAASDTAGRRPAPPGAQPRPPRGGLGSVCELGGIELAVV